MLFVDEESDNGGLDIPASCFAHCDELREKLEVRTIARHVDVIAEMGYTLFLEPSGDHALEGVTRRWSRAVKTDNALRVAYWTGAMVMLEPNRQPGSVRERFGERNMASYFEDYFRRARASGTDGVFFHSICRFNCLPGETQDQIAVAVKRVFRLPQKN